ncbi:type II secretion system F family protein [Miniimonas arenae]|uniref:Type II secretion system F family protein n=1 Tax=Miniimonas arenae TaxID=676201 RepID=A0A5C5BD11_9MICO|nr:MULTISPECIES: type II secretion system F family protein [Miniimonas]TNU75816.1 type II secretion system F family protein [Miniimonas arenae]
MNAVGALTGLVAASGLLVIASAWRAARPSLVDRVAPYVTARASTSTLLGAPDNRTATGLHRLLVPLVQDASRALEHLGSSASTVRRRLQRLGGTTTLEQFRLEQLGWAAIGLGVGVAVGTLLATTRGVAIGPLAVLVAVAAVGGALARDRALTHAVESRERRIAAELPTVAELLALAVGAGESPAAALDRIARSTDGDLSREIARTLADVRAGATVTAAFDALARRVDLPALTRFADGVAVAVERGSPLGEVLRAQAADARESAKRELMESGGRREIGMLVPVVFVLLPLTVLFALFPGIAMLQLGP